MNTTHTTPETWKLVPVEPTEAMEIFVHKQAWINAVDAAPAPPVQEDGPMMVRGTNANGIQWMGTMRQVMEDYKQAAEIEAREADRLRQRIAELESPPVPASVQEIMRLMGPYIRASLDFATAFPDGELEGADAACTKAFKPLEAALTALVDERDRLKFELDGVRAMRGPLSDEHRKDLLAAAFYIAAKDDEHAILKSDDAERIVDLLSELSGFAPPTHGIEPEQGESHAK